MFVIGKATEAEIEEMTKHGFDVEPVDVRHFDKALGDEGNECDYEATHNDPDKLVAIFLDYDIVDECRDIIAAQK